MKIAIAYDWLNQKHGGGEDTLAEILRLYPKADLFCLIYNQKKFKKITNGRKVITSRLQKYPEFIKKRPFLFLPFIKKAVTKFNFSNYDLVITVSSAWVKNIKTPDNCVHICYCFSPARMLWDSWPGYLSNQKIGIFKVGPFSKFVIAKIVSKLRLWDYYSSKNVDEFIAISQYIKRRIKKYYGRECRVVYPPVKLATSLLPIEEKKQERNFYIIVSVLSKYKNIDLAIRAFIINKLPLVIVGDGPDKHRLVELARNYKNIHFHGREDENKKFELLSQAKAFIFCSVEDFGIAPIEALSAGTPVIAPDAGGLAETIVNNETGVLYKQFNPKSLNSAIQELDQLSFTASKLIKSAEKYSVDNFKKNFSKNINEILKDHEK